MLPQKYADMAARSAEARAERIAREQSGRSVASPFPKLTAEKKRRKKK